MFFLYVAGPAQTVERHIDRLELTSGSLSNRRAQVGRECPPPDERGLPSTNDGVVARFTRLMPLVIKDARLVRDDLNPT